MSYDFRVRLWPSRYCWSQHYSRFEMNSTMLESILLPSNLLVKPKAVRSSKSFELHWIFAKFNRILQKKKRWKFRSLLTVETETENPFDSWNRNLKLAILKLSKLFLKLSTHFDRNFWKYVRSFKNKRRFLRYSTYFQKFQNFRHICWHITVDFSVSITFSVSFAKVLDIRNSCLFSKDFWPSESRTMSKNQESRKAENLVQPSVYASGKMKE